MWEESLTTRFCDDRNIDDYYVAVESRDALERRDLRLWCSASWVIGSRYFSLKEGRRVYVRMEGPEHVSDEELLRRALVREGKLQRTVWELDGRTSELERNEARESAAASGRAYEEMEEAYSRERATHGGTDGWPSGSA